MLVARWRLLLGALACAGKGGGRFIWFIVVEVETRCLLLVTCCSLTGAEGGAGKGGRRFMWFIWFILFIVACLPVGRFMLFRTGARDRWLNV